MECYAVDESGYTGHDLLNTAQPIQTLACVSITENEATELIQRHFSRFQSNGELKYSSIGRNRKWRPTILDFISDLSHNHKMCIFAANKFFLLINKYLDYAVEPAFYAMYGGGFYKDGRNLCLASLLYMIYYAEDINNNLKKDLTVVFIAFQKAMKNKTDKDIVDLINKCSLLLINHKQSYFYERLLEVFFPMAHASSDCIMSLKNPSMTNDIAEIMLNAIISRMEVMSNNPYTILHDESKQLQTYQMRIEKLIKYDGVKKFTITGITNLSFPLKVKSVTQGNSRSHSSLQVADILAGAFMFATKNILEPNNSREDKDYRLELFKSIKEDQFFHFSPNFDFSSEYNLRQGGQVEEMINFVAEEIYAKIE